MLKYSAKKIDSDELDKELLRCEIKLFMLRLRTPRLRKSKKDYGKKWVPNLFKKHKCT